jgi:predicted PurR-regulated permease PerM
LTRPDPLRDLSSLLAVVVAVVGIAILYFAKGILIAFALAALFSFLLTPMVIWMERIRFPRVLAVLLAIVFSIGTVGSVGWIVANQLVDVTNQLPAYKTNIKEKLESLRTSRSQRLNKATESMKELGQEIAAAQEDRSAKKPSAAGSPTAAHPLPVEVIPPTSNALESARDWLGPAGTVGIVIVFMTFMLMRREDLRNRFIRLAGGGRLNEMTQTLDEAGTRVSRYLLLQLVVNTCYGLIIGVALHFIGVPNALLWGVAAGLFRFLPYIGPPIGALLPVLMSLAVFQDWSRPLMTIGLFVFLELVVANFVEPMLYGAHTGISALAILVAAVFWTALWGPIGLFLSTPLTVCLVVLARHIPQLSFLHILLGDEPVLSPEARYYQRLLATDQNEARQVLENYLKEKPLIDLYDFVLVPALNLAEQDRHSNNLDESSERFVCQSTKEIIEELAETPVRQPEASEPEDEVSLSDRPAVPLLSPTNSSSAARVVCVPARDEADEIVGIMLAQLLERAGHSSVSISIGTTAEMLTQVAEEKPDLVCISALPPFALGHARALHKKLHAQLPDVKILVGMWNFTGDPVRIANRMGIEHPIALTLAQAVQQIVIAIGITPAPRLGTADVRLTS